LNRSLKAHLLLVLVTLVWGATFVVIKNALAEITPLLFNAIRMTLAAIALFVIFRKKLHGITRRAIISGFVVGVFLFFGYQFQTTGLRLTTPSKSAFLTGVSVVLVPVFLALFWRRRISHGTLFGVICAFIGLYLMTIPSGGALHGVNLGDVLSAGCAVGFAFQIIFTGRATTHHPFAQISCVMMASCAALMWLTIPLIERPHMQWTPNVLWAIVVTGLLGTAAAFTIQAWAQQFTPPTHTALIFSLEPVFAWMTSFVVLGERLGVRAAAGAGLILAGVLISELLGSAKTSPNEELEQAGDKAV
jgi:drug/metabolite transporter (DMT)-like permease